MAKKNYVIEITQLVGEVGHPQDPSYIMDWGKIYNEGYLPTLEDYAPCDVPNPANAYIFGDKKEAEDVAWGINRWYKEYDFDCVASVVEDDF